MKKIVLISAAMGGAALVAFGASGTFASFSDRTTQNVSAVAADSVVVNSWDKTTAQMATNPLAPGESVERAFYVRNSGTVAGKPSAQLLNIINKDDGCTSSTEQAVDDCTVEAAGDLAAQVVVGYTTFAPSENGDCVVPANPQYSRIGKLNDIIGQSAFAPTAPQLGAGQAVCVAFQLKFESDANDNKAQGDSFTAQIQFGLEQA